MKQIRITGLVRLAQDVRRQWAASTNAAHHQQLIARIEQSLGHVDTILREHHASPACLPSPSRRAYALLVQIAREAPHSPTASHAPRTDAGTGADEPPAPLPESIGLAGLKAFHTRLLDNIALSVCEQRGDADRLLEVITKTCGRLDRMLEQQGFSPDQLKPNARELLAWFRWFSQPQHLCAYLDGVSRAQRVLGLEAANQLKWTRPLLVRFSPSNSTYHWRATRHGTQIALATPLLALDEPGLTLLGRWMAGNRAAGHMVTEMLVSGTCRSLAVSLKSTVGEARTIRGMVHDLSASFDRINKRFFDGRMSAPRLTWSRTLTGRRFGHYAFDKDTVCISSTLDRPDVPEFVIDHVMHHELLHKKHGMKWSGQRRRVHTAAFRTDERQFPQFPQADAFLKKLAGEC